MSAASTSNHPSDDSTKNLPQWLTWIEAQHQTSIDLGLQRVADCYQQLNLPKLAKQIVSFAGTNGKGSTIACVESVLLASSVKVGVYTSPHLLMFNERVRINGKMVDDDVLCQAFSSVKQAVEDCQNVDSLSFFEFTTLAALCIFAHSDCEVVLLEVGLGGRLDAVNIVDNDIAVITSIGLDHQDWLGDTEQQIAFEKAGIIRANAKLVCGALKPAVQAQMQAIADEKQCQAMFNNEHFYLTQNPSSWHWQNDTKNIAHQLDTIHLPENSIACAIQILHFLDDVNIDWSQLEPAISQTKLAGRFQQFYTSRGSLVVMDVAHNPDAAQLLAKRLSQQVVKGKRMAVFSVFNDKDRMGMIDGLKSCFDHWYVAPLQHPRATDANSLADTFEQFHVLYESCDSIADAYRLAFQRASNDDIIVVFGSFHVLAEAAEYIQAQAQERELFEESL